METSKPVKNRRFRGFIKQNRKPLFKGILVLLVLGATAGIAYNAGLSKGTTQAKTKKTITSPLFDNLKNMAKDTKSKATPAASPLLATNSSGFFRLSGTVTAVKKQTISIKLGDGTVMTLTTPKDAKFYSGTPRTAKPINQLKTGTAIFVVGTIGSKGTFTASNIQAQK